MKRLTLVCYILASTAFPAQANDVNALTKEKELLTLKDQISELKKKISANRAEEAKKEAERLISEIVVAQKTKELEAKLAETPSVKIKIVYANIYSALNSDEKCNALYFAEWSCNGQNNCDFPIDESICGNPTRNTDPKIMSVKYLCDKQEKTNQTPWGQQARLTCNK